MTEVRAYFRTAADARYALNALRASNFECTPPRFGEQDGRSWYLLITLDPNGPSNLYPSPVRIRVLNEIVTRFGGRTSTWSGPQDTSARDWSHPTV